MKRAPIIVAIVAVVALAESALGLYGPRAVATDADWKAAADRVRTELGPSDLIVFAPAWVDPVGRKHLGDRMPVAMVARADAAPYARIWELSIRGDRAEETRALTPVFEQRFGNVTLRRYEQKPVEVRYDFTAHLAEAQPSTHANGRPEERRPCAVEGNAVRCGGTRVEPRVLEVDYRPRRGLLAPIIAGETLELAYEDVPSGTLVGYVGLHDYYARKNGDGVVLMRAQVDDQAAVTLPVRNEDGWRRFELPMQGEGKHRVRFSLSSDKPAWRLPGFHAEVRAP